MPPSAVLCILIVCDTGVAWRDGQGGGVSFKQLAQVFREGEHFWGMRYINLNLREVSREVPSPSVNLGKGNAPNPRQLLPLYWAIHLFLLKYTSVLNKLEECFSSQSLKKTIHFTQSVIPIVILPRNILTHTSCVSNYISKYLIVYSNWYKINGLKNI